MCHSLSLFRIYYKKLSLAKYTCVYISLLSLLNGTDKDIFFSVKGKNHSIEISFTKWKSAVCWITHKLV